MGTFQTWKNWLVASTGVEKDGMHVIVGVLLLLLSAMLMRRRLGDWRPILVVLVAALAGEAWDLWEYWSLDGSLRLNWSWHDIKVTLLCPLVIFALSRWTRALKP